MNEGMQRELQGRIEAFATDVTEILRRAVADADADALKGAGTRRSPSTKITKTTKGTKQGMVVEADALLREIKREGDRRMELLAKSLRTTTKALIRPMQKLLAEKKVKTRGQARGTKYRRA